MPDIAEIFQRIYPARYALRALRYFTAITRGFRDREQKKLARFLREVAPLDDFTEAQVVEWLKTKAGAIGTYPYKTGDLSEYRALLQAIPPELLTRTRDYALLIARGSGRKQLSDEFRTRVEIEFTRLEPLADMPRRFDGSVDLYGEGPEGPYADVRGPTSEG